MKSIKLELEHTQYQSHDMITDQLRDRGWSYIQGQVIKQVQRQIRDQVLDQLRDHVHWHMRGSGY